MATILTCSTRPRSFHTLSLFSSPSCKQGIISEDLAHKLPSLPNQIALVAEDTGGSAIAELHQALNEYLSVLISLTKKEYSLEGLLEFKWRNLEDERQDSYLANAWFEMLSAIHLMAMLTLSEADSLMVPKENSDSGIMTISSDSKREAVNLLLKASGYLEFCVRNVLTQIPPEIKEILAHDLQDCVLAHHLQDGLLEAISFQALGEGTEIQLGLALESHKAYHCLSGCGLINQGDGRKHLRFIKWKFLEAKAAAYYCHGLILDKGKEPSSHVSADSCFLAAEDLLAESKKACLNLCVADPVTRAPPLWDAMKLLHQKIPEVASRKSQMYGYLLE